MTTERKMMTAQVASEKREVPKEVQDLFDRYLSYDVRVLKRAEALGMLQQEFGLNPEQAAAIFDTFDRQNTGTMNIFDFHQFYKIAGHSASEMVAKFKEMDADGSGLLDKEEAIKGLSTIRLSDGRHLTGKELMCLVDSCRGPDDELMHFGHFVKLLHRLKLYDDDQKKDKTNTPVENAPEEDEEDKWW